VKANLGTDGDRGKSVDCLDVYLVIHARMERGDEVGVGSVEGGGTRDVGEEVLPYELILRTPDFPSIFVEDSVKMRVSRRRISARRGSEEVGKKVEVVGDFVEGGRRLYGGGSDWGRAPNNVFGRWVTKGGSGRAGWEDGGDGWRDVLNFLKREFLDELVEIGSVGGDVGKKVQRLVLNFVELAMSNSEEGAEEEACWQGRDVVVEERRGRGENVLVGAERVLDGGGGGVEVGLVG